MQKFVDDGHNGVVGTAKGCVASIFYTQGRVMVLMVNGTVYSYIESKSGFNELVSALKK